MNTSPLSTVSIPSSSEVRRRAAPFLPKARISVRIGLWSVLLGIGLISPLAQAIGWLHLPLLANRIAPAQQRWMSYALHPGMLFLRAVIIYPIIEELVYRGLMLPLLRRYAPLWLAIGGSAGLFGITHLAQGVGSALNAFVLGVAFSWLVVRTGSLFASMMCHAAVNFSWLFLITPGFGIMERILQLDPKAPQDAQSAMSLPTWWLLTSLGLAIAAAVGLNKFMPPRTST
jgi:membrane protease YdiL (CAAX protease family)